MLAADASVQATAPLPLMPDWDTDRLVTYSRSITIDLTYRCLARCGYCEYRKDEGGLVTPVEVEFLLDRAVETDCREVLVMAGERPWDLPDIAEALASRFPERRDSSGPLRGIAAEAAFIDLAIEVSQVAMRRGLLPHTNLGVLSRARWSASSPGTSRWA